MSRTIKESTELLETSLQEIKSKLDEKVGGGVSSPLKVSQIAGYLDQIKTGGVDLPPIMQGDCLVIVKGHLNPNDYSVSLSSKKYGESLENNFRDDEIIKKWYDTVFLYILYVSTSSKKVYLKEEQTNDEETRTASSGIIDVSKEGIVYVEMS